MKKLIILLTTIIIIGCTQVDDYSNETNNNTMPMRLINDTQINESDTIINNTVSGIALFFTDTISNQEEYLRGTDINWESSSKGVFRYLPKSDRADLVKWYTSHSWSKSSCYAYTTANRLFIIRDWDSDWTSDDTSWTLEEYEPYSLELLSSTDFNAGSFAIINDKIYYQTPIIKNFYGQVTGGGDLKVQSLGDTSSQARLVFEDFTGGLYGVGDYLITSLYDLEAETLTLSNVDLSTGALSTLHTISTSNSPYNDLFPGHNAMYHLVQDGNIIYINRYPVQDEASTILEVELIGDEQGIYVGEDNNVIAILTYDSSYNITSLFTYNLNTEEIKEININPFSTPISYSRIGVPLLELTS